MRNIKKRQSSGKGQRPDKVKMHWKIPLFKIYWDEEDVEAISNALRKGTNWAVGPEVVRFEEKLNG